MNRTERFATDPIPVLVRRTCTPPALSMLAQGVDIVDDGLFVAHYGELAYRASTVAYPVQVAVMAVAVGTSIGVNSVLSRALGRHDGRGAHVFRQMALGFVFCGVANTLALCCTATGNGRVLMVATYLRQLIVPLPLFALIMGAAGVSWACLAFVAGDVCAALYARSAWGRAI